MLRCSKERWLSLGQDGRWEPQQSPENKELVTERIRACEGNRRKVKIWGSTQGPPTFSLTLCIFVWVWISWKCLFPLWLLLRILSKGWIFTLLSPSPVALVEKNLPDNAGDMRYRFSPWMWKTPWRREWHPTPVFLPGEFHGQMSLVSYSPWSCKESGKGWVTNI